MSALTKRLIAEGCEPHRHRIEMRCDHLGPMRLLARAEGYVMVRRPGSVPRVLSAAEWDRLPTEQPGTAA